MNLKTQISDLLAQSHLDEALDLAKQHALAGKIEFDTPLTILRAKWDYTKRKALAHALSFEKENEARQDLIFNLLELAEQIDSATTPPPSPNTPPSPKNVLLFLGANPFEKLVLGLDRELQMVSDGLTHFGQRDAFDFRAKMHVTPADLQRMLLEAQKLQPRFVHFAGNAVVDHPTYGTGVIFEDERSQPRIVSGDLLATIFRQFPTLQCVFLNTCDSGPSALAVGQAVQYAIGMNDRIIDDAAIIFAVAFYEAIASGNDIPFAFEFAKNRLLLSHLPDQATVPVLIANGQAQDITYHPGPSHLEDCDNPRILR
jgi:hypothetical protein